MAARCALMSGKHVCDLSVTRLSGSSLNRSSSSNTALVCSQAVRRHIMQSVERTEKPEASVLTARRATQHVRLSSADDAYEHFVYSEPSSQAPLLGPGPLRTGRETFVLIRLKPCERLFEGDAASIRKGADGEPCRGTLDEVEPGFPRSSNHPSQEGRSGEGASP